MHPLMSITFTIPDLEAKIEELGQRQDVPVSKHAMAIAILREAVRDDRGRPVNAWRSKSRKFQRAKKSSSVITRRRSARRRLVSRAAEQA